MIFTFRAKKVMVYSDLAILYEVQTKRLKEQGVNVLIFETIPPFHHFSISAFGLRNILLLLIL